MRTFISLVASCTTLLFPAQDETSLKKFAEKNKDLLSLNAIVADKTYYSQSILEYQIVKKLLAMNSLVEDVKENDPITGKQFYKKVTVLPKVKYNTAENLNTKECYFRLPETITDLSSGFQFRHYLFKGSNTTALQAFGILNNEFNKEDLYVIIDYIQYKDNTCQNLPTIRYAVGIRSEFKISSMNMNKKNDGDTNNLSIENLAASVQFDRLKVNISLKTIGLTGKAARLNIPSNTSFNVQTYGEYVKVIDFIRNHLDSADVSPELIPIMDAHRTSLADINTTAFDEILEIENRYRRYERKFNKKGRMAKSNIDSVLRKALEHEVNEKVEKHKQLIKIDKSLTDLEQHNKLLNFLSGTQDSSVKNTDVAYKLGPEHSKILNEINKRSLSDLGNRMDTVNDRVLKDLIDGRIDAQIENTNIFNSEEINRNYNDAITLIAAGKNDDAIKELEKIYKIKPTYGNVQEILNLLRSERSKEEINSIIVKDYKWLINDEILNKLKKEQ